MRNATLAVPACGSPFGRHIRTHSDALNPEARCRVVRPCLEGSESRNRLSGVPACPVFLLRPGSRCRALALPARGCGSNVELNRTGATGGAPVLHQAPTARAKLGDARRVPPVSVVVSEDHDLARDSRSPRGQRRSVTPAGKTRDSLARRVNRKRRPCRGSSEVCSPLQPCCSWPRVTMRGPRQRWRR